MLGSPEHRQGGLSAGDHLALQGPQVLQLSEEETRILAQLLQDLFAEGPIQGELQALHPQRWYLRLTQVPQAQFTPLQAVIGRDIFAALPQGPDGAAWRTLLTEVQALSEELSERGRKLRAEIEALGGPAIEPA